MPKIVVNLTMEKKTRDAGSKLAAADNRSLSNYIETLIEREVAIKAAAARVAEWQSEMRPEGKE